MVSSNQGPNTLLYILKMQIEAEVQRKIFFILIRWKEMGANKKKSVV